MLQRIVCLSTLALLPACATIVEGTSDTVTVSTTPDGASCVLERNGGRVGAVSPTPGSVRIDKSRMDLRVICTKDGYRSATTTVQPSFTGSTLANILLGGVVGIAVDAASGANSRYPSDIRLALKSGAPAETAPSIAALSTSPTAGQSPIGAAASANPPKSNPPSPFSGNLVCPRAGTVMTTTTDETITSVGGDGLDCQYRSSRFSSYTLHGALARIKTTQGGDAPSQIVEAVDSLWPLSDGNTAQARVSTFNQLVITHWRVSGPEAVKVEAGNFSAWRFDIHWENPMRGAEMSRQVWWSPDVGYVVKSQTIKVSGSWVVEPSWEMASIQSH